MACMKCGRKTENEQYFCRQCQEGMLEHPVKMNIAIQLPSHPTEPEPVKRRRRRLFPEETIEYLRAAVRWEAATIAVLFVALCIVSGLLAWEWLQPKEFHPTDFNPNYTVTDRLP